MNVGDIDTLLFTDNKFGGSVTMKQCRRPRLVMSSGTLLNLQSSLKLPYAKWSILVRIINISLKRILRLLFVEFL